MSQDVRGGIVCTVGYALQPNASADSIESPIESNVSGMLLKSQQVLLCTEIDYWQKRPELSFEEYKIIIKNKLLISFWSSGRDCTSYPWEIS